MFPVFRTSNFYTFYRAVWTKQACKCDHALPCSFRFPSIFPPCSFISHVFGKQVFPGIQKQTHLGQVRGAQRGALSDTQTRGFP